MPSCVDRVEGTGIPVRGDNIDTDRIIPARFLKAITFDGLGDHLFDITHAVGHSQTIGREVAESTTVMAAARGNQ